jgi:hypothetical protein
MYEALHRIALATVFAVGMATLIALNELAGLTLADQHRQMMLAALAAALMLSPWLPALRQPAIAAALATKAALVALAVSANGVAALGSSTAEALQILALMAAGAVLLLEARLEARWDGVLPLRQEG